MKPDDTPYLTFRLPDKESTDKMVREAVVRRIREDSGIMGLTDDDFFICETEQDGKSHATARPKTRCGELAINAMVERQKPDYSLVKEIKQLIEWGRNGVLDFSGCWLLAERLGELTRLQCREALHEHGMRQDLSDTDVPQRL